MLCIGRRILALGLMAAAATGLTTSLAASGPTLDELPGPADEFGGYASTHIVVQVAPGVTPWQQIGNDQWTFVHDEGDADAGATAQIIADTLVQWQVLDIAPAIAFEIANGQLAAQIGLDRYYRIDVPAGTDTPTFADQLADFPSFFKSSEIDGIGGAADEKIIPDDEHFDLQWGMRNTGQVINGRSGVENADIHAPTAWGITTGIPSMVLAVLDAGTDEHVDLEGKMVDGWNTVSNNDNTGDSCVSHGTHVAGIAAAIGNNTEGVAGVNWAIRVMPVRVLNGCAGSETDCAEGIIWAVDHGANLINMSLQYFTGTSFFEDAVQYGYESGIPMIAAAGNDNASVSYPARWPQTIAVAATDNHDEHASFSNPGPELDIAAPGDDVYSLTGFSSYGYKDGTSMASPHVAGAVSLMLALDPELTIEELRQILIDTADDIENAGFDTLTGWGRLNAFEALDFIDAGLNILGDLNDDGVVDSTDLLLMLGAWGVCNNCDNCTADLDDDCDVDGVDLLMLLGNWG